jgi:hypothetical protein
MATRVHQLVIGRMIVVVVAVFVVNGDIAADGRTVAVSPRHFVVGVVQKFMTEKAGFPVEKKVE